MKVSEGSIEKKKGKRVEIFIFYRHDNRITDSWKIPAPEDDKFNKTQQQFVAF